MKISSRVQTFGCQMRWLVLAFSLLSLACILSAAPKIDLPEPSQAVAGKSASTPQTAPSATPLKTTSPKPVSKQPIATNTNQTATPTQVETTGLVSVSFVNVGQGDAIVIRSPEGHVILIDGGELGSGIVAYLQKQEIDHLDLMVATHPHSDHIGGLVDVLEAMPVDRVITNGQPHTTQIYERFLDGIIHAEAAYEEARRGEVLSVGNLAFHVLHPYHVSGTDLNDNSLVLRLTVGDVSFLFTGDAHTSAESVMLGSGLPLAADVLKVGHHGSHTSSSPAFLEKVNPAIAVYMAGHGNSYGHPHVETLAALSKRGIKILGTDTHGTITITTDGHTYEIVTEALASHAPPGLSHDPNPHLVDKQTVRIFAFPNPVPPGALANLEVQTAPGALCGITVSYKSGPSKAKGLEAKPANSEGIVAWRWKVGTNTTPGLWPVVVTCTLDGQIRTVETVLKVER